MSTLEERVVPGSVVGGMLLVAGSCIGAGMLALPILTGLAGFFPSLSIMVFSWAFMTFTALLLVEASGWVNGHMNLVSMVKQSLGKTGLCVCWISYLLLFYSILVAYIAASSSIFSSVFYHLFNLPLPNWTASLFFTAFFGYFVYLGTRSIDLFNRLLMAGLISTYLAMIALGVSRIQPKLLMHWAPEFMFFSLPVLVISFGFHNLIPSLTSYMKGDLRRVRLTVIGGSAITLAVYLIWSLLFLGVVPFQGPSGILESYEKGAEATSALHTYLGSTAVSSFAQGFAFFAIVTSFLAQGLSLTHFLADGMKLSITRRSGRLVCLLALIPPLIFALLYPHIFFKALDFAGGVCALILFGILPVFMIWVGRYRKGLTSNYQVSSGKLSLILVVSLCIFVIGCELARIFSF